MPTPEEKAEAYFDWRAVLLGIIPCEEFREEHPEYAAPFICEKTETNQGGE